MSSYLAQFNYQFVRPAGTTGQPEDFRDKGLRRFVFLHGLMGYGLNWRRIATGLNPNDIALIYDQRGHGKSFQPPMGYASEDYAQDLELIAQEIGWDRFYLVGHSMGARNALMFAHKFPEKVIKLVLEDIGPESKPQDVDYYRQLLGAVPTPFANKLVAKEFFLNEFLRLPLAGRHPQTLGAYLYSNIIEKENGQADWRFSKEAIFLSVSQGRAKDHWSELRLLTMPGLVIRGESSTELSSEVYQRMLASNPRLRGVEIPNAGHWVHSDQPELFIRALLEFVNS